MKLNPSQGRMFRSVDYTGTYYQGCDHFCVYCWTLFMPYGPISHEPKLVQKDEFELLKERDAVVFLQSAHDSFANCIPDEWIRSMLRWIGRQDPSLTFYLQSKNIGRAVIFYDLLADIKDRVILGTTLETNFRIITDEISKAPPPVNRYAALLTFSQAGFRTRLSLEPLFKFNFERMRKWILKLRPELVEVGLDNYAKRHGVDMPQPDLWTYERLKRALVNAGIQVNEKDSIVKWREKNE